MKSHNKSKLNIITVVRNDQKGILITLNSILSLALKNKDVIFVNYIQDGSSTDRTLKFAKDFKVRNTAKNLHFVIKSANDKGIFDAMNKATANLINGDLVLYLNAGDAISDEFNDISLSKILKNFIRSSSILACFRSKNVINELSYYMPPHSIRDNKAFQVWIKKNTPVHQSMIFKVTKSCPIHYPLCFKNQADSFLFFYLTRYFGGCKFYNFTICRFELGGNSGNYKKIRKVILQFYEQSLIILLRSQSKIYLIGYLVSFFAKYIMHNILGERFIKLHAHINRLLRK
jgi:hypothetical protein